MHELYGCIRSWFQNINVGKDNQRLQELAQQYKERHAAKNSELEQVSCLFTLRRVLEFFATELSSLYHKISSMVT